MQRLANSQCTAAYKISFFLWALHSPAKLANVQMIVSGNMHTHLNVLLSAIRPNNAKQYKRNVAMNQCLINNQFIADAMSSIVVRIVKLLVSINTVTPVLVVSACLPVHFSQCKLCSLLSM